MTRPVGRGGRMDAERLPRTLKAGRYRRIGPLRQGGAAIVGEYHDDARGEHVAVRIVTATTPSGRRDAYRTARLLAGHPAPLMPAIHDGWADDRSTYLAMALVEGTPLEALAATPWSTGDIIALLRDVLGSLAQLHPLGIVHGAIGPRTILRAADGHYWPTDPRLADDTVATPAGTTAEPTARASPEQREEQGTTVRSDLYSLGATAYRMWTGSAPPPTLAHRGLAAPVGASHEALGAADRQLDAALSRMLQPRPDDRPASARDALQLLEAPAERPGQFPGLRRWGTRGYRVGHRVWIIIGAVSILISAGLLPALPRLLPSYDPRAWRRTVPTIEASPTDRPSSVAASGGRLSSAAVQQLGKPYRAGASGPEMFDNPGLVAYATHLSLGITLPNTAAGQAQAGTPIDRGEITTGTLIFFPPDAGSGGSALVGVGLGDGRMVIALAPGGVTIVPLGESPWRDTYVGARRIVAPHLGPELAQAAASYIGRPYAPGGATPAGWDDAGFVLYIYRAVTGIVLPHAVNQQYAYGTALADNQVRAADIVFFADVVGAGVDHDGIALGDGRFSHVLTTPGGTVVDSLTDPYWLQHYAGARRP